MSEIAERLTENLEALTRDESGLIQRVYEDLFEHHTSVAELFALHRRAVRTDMLREVLAIAVAQAEGDSWVDEYLDSLGFKHSASGVTPEMYDWFVECLMRVFAEISGPQWCSELEEGWRDVLGQVSAAMLAAGAGAAES
jgi:hemoglobin-like flavoprotein